MNDRDVIEAQIGRAPRGLFGVPVRCSYGYPQVIRVAPLVEGKPFPTLYWLTCPHLVRAIDRLEADGWIGRLERRLADDDVLRRRMERAHDRYVAERADLLSDDVRRAAGTGGPAASLLEKGIGGIADRARLKCLHLHVAHAMAGENPVGSIVLAMLPATECRLEEEICSALGEGGADRTGRIDR